MAISNEATPESPLGRWEMEPPKTNVGLKGEFFPFEEDTPPPVISKPSSKPNKWVKIVAFSGPSLTSRVTQSQRGNRGSGIRPSFTALWLVNWWLAAGWWKKNMGICSMKSWQSKGAAPRPTPPRNKALIRPY